MPELPRFHAADWDEPLVMEMGAPGRRGYVPPRSSQELPRHELTDAIPAELLRRDPPNLPELSEFEVQRHYLHLAQETLGMMGISLFGTCTMKYNPRLSEALAGRPQIAELHPEQDEDTLQGVLEVLYRDRKSVV